MASHGGFFLNYYSGSEVTHIVCANLPDTKVKHLERTKQRCAHALQSWLLVFMPCSCPHIVRSGGRDPKPIVHPDWIVDSLKAGTQLPVSFPMQRLPAHAFYSRTFASGHQRHMPSEHAG